MYYVIDPPTWLLDGYSLFKVDLVDFDNFSPYWKQTWSGALVWFPLWQTVFTVFSIYVDYLEFAQLCSVCFQDGGSKPEVVYRCTYLRWIRGFLIDYNSPRLQRTTCIALLEIRVER